MSYFKNATFLLSLLITPFFVEAAGYQADPFHNMEYERNQPLVERWLKPFRIDSYYFKWDQLKFNGDIQWNFGNRTESQVNEEGQTIFLRGPDRIAPFTATEVEVNLRANYKAEGHWANFAIQAANSVGTEIFTRRWDPYEIFKCSACGGDPCGPHGSGTFGEISLSKAYFGITLWETKTRKLNMEIGRNKMSSLFDSRIEFGSRFDGIAFFYTDDEIPFTGIETDLMVTGGPFIVDERSNHFGFAVETDFNQINASNFDIKYSFIDWRKLGRNRYNCYDPFGWKFQNSQFFLAYTVSKDYVPKRVRFYGAFLINTAARSRTITITEKHTEKNKDEQNIEVITTYHVHVPRANLGGYAGVIIGEVKKKWDWSLDFNVQAVQAQAIPDPDVDGIGTGNILKENFSESARGKTNYKGWELQTLVRFTDILNFTTKFQMSWSLDPEISRGQHKYTRVSVGIVCLIM